MDSEVEPMSHTVGELAKLTRVSVRTLHHYDEIGLLSPSDRTRAGYRLYNADDAERLHRILVYRELGFDLKRIAEILDDPAADAMAHLRRQRELLHEQVERLQQTIRSVEVMMNAKKSGLNLSDQEMREVFGAFDPGEHEAEAEQRWGETDAYKESRRRTTKYGKQEWLAIKAEAEQIESGMAAALREGLPPTSAAAMDLAEQHRQHISRWFYDCDYAIHRGLAQMYVADARFGAHYEQRAAGLSQYMHDAVIANAERANR
jgi:MerR family transcriptional regulator, thiopeptide resistance regulator